jgi:hypothetical protein
MTYTVDHLFVDEQGKTSIRTRDGKSQARFSRSGTMAIHFPGKIEIYAVAHYFLKIRNDGNGGPSRPWLTQSEILPLKVEIRTPDGNLFTADHVSLADLSRFRDLRGVSHGTWSYSVHGESATVDVEDGNTKLVASDARVRIAVAEPVTSKSAAPLVNLDVGATQGRGFGFDLWRVGTFTASARSGGLVPGRQRKLRLSDPDSNVVAESGTDRFRFSYPPSLKTGAGRFFLEHEVGIFFRSSRVAEKR